ncbi:MAG TPA: exodeoxyribonuclease V subunit gamma, partial [Holophagaceae bacterium]
MLSLTYANRTERLLEALAARLREERETFGIWEPLRLVVPNPNVKRYLLDGLGRHLGILAHHRVDYLDGLWREPLEALEPPVRLWTRHALQGGILSLLSQPGALEATDLAPLKRYLHGEGAELKLIQLAEKTAELLEEYSLSRPEWAAAWTSGRSVTGAPPELEAWQRALWTRLQAGTQGGPARWRTLAGLLKDGLFDRVPLPPRIHVFGLSYEAEVYHRAFEIAARRADVHLYALNPCQEFWDDLPSEAEIRRRTRRLGSLADPGEDPYALEAGEDPLLLRRWGRPGRENVRLLNEISGCDFTAAFEEPETDTLLHRLQAGLQLRQPVEPGGADGSLKVLACPSPAREADVVASEIWRLMEAAPADRPLRFSEIAVVIPPDPALRRAYLDHLRTAFDATGRIPFVAVDDPSPALAALLDGAELLLDLPLGRGSRRDLLRALTHPAVRARFPELEPAAWADWAEAAGIVRGLGPEDLADEPLLDPGLLHWQQGLERLALAAFLPPEASWQGEGFERPSARTGDPQAVGAFLDRASSLLNGLRDLRGRPDTPAGWAERLGRYLLAHLGSDDAVDAGGRARLAQALERFGAMVPEGLAPPKLTYRQARELARQALAGLRHEAGGRPHQGVVVGSYAPMRALPFRAIFLMGLAEGQFPAPEERQPLDLRLARRKPGDVGPAERDRYLFLEMVLGARDSLRLTYPNEDPVSRERRLPSAVVQDLVQALAPLGFQELQEVHPRDRFDAAYFPATGEPTLRSLAPAALREAQARAAGAILVGACPGLDSRPWSAVPLPASLRADLDALVAPCPVPETAAPQEARVISLAQLRTWLACPVQGAARVRLNLREDREDLAELEEEALGTSALVRGVLRREAFLRAARTGRDSESTYLDLRREAVRAGRAAPGLLGAAEVDEDLDLLRRQLRALAGAPVRLVRLGPARDPEAEADEILAPLSLTVDVLGRPVAVQLVGALQPQVADASLFLARKAGVKARNGLMPAFRAKLLLAWLDHHLLAALAGEALSHGALELAGADDAGKAPGAFRSTVAFPALAPEAARARLQ